MMSRILAVGLVAGLAWGYAESGDALSWSSIVCWVPLDHRLMFLLVVPFLYVVGVTMLKGDR